MSTRKPAIGQSLSRVEDASLITGQPAFVADMPEAQNALYVAILRAPVSSAIVNDIDVESASDVSGVRQIITAADLSEVGALPCDWFPVGDGTPVLHPILAKNRIVYHGQPIAAVAAESRSAALDALDKIKLDMSELPCVVDQEQALDPDAPLVHSDRLDNLAFRYAHKAGNFDRACKNADVRFSLQLVNNRVAAAALEGRVVLSKPAPDSGFLDHWSSTQLPHVHARALAKCLGHPLNRLRFRVPSVGGGFGGKLSFYAEDVICAALALRTGSACLWVEGRTESFMATTHGRDHIQKIEVAASSDGKVTGLSARLIADMGAFALGMGPGIAAFNAGHSLTGPYDIRDVSFAVEGVYTNRTPTGPYRGAGHPEATYLIERVMEAVAQHTGIDPVEVRRRNLVKPSQMPYRLATGLTLDSGDYGGLLDHALKLADHRSLIEWRDGCRHSGLLAGVGVAIYSENSGAAPSMGMGAIGFQRGGHESARVVVHPDGRITVFSGAQAQGQGHKTSLAQIAADALDVPFEYVEVVQGDTASIPFGTGTFNSRTVAVGGAAVWNASKRIAKKMHKIAAYRLGSRSAHVVQENNHFRSKRETSTGRIISSVAARARGVVFRKLTGLDLGARGPRPQQICWSEVAEAAHLGHDIPLGMKLGLDETEFFDPSDMPFSYGCHIVAVAIDPATGHLGIHAHTIVDDAGRIINPKLAEGQMQGGAAQGIGQALYENISYDSSGNLPITGFRTYAVPRAIDLPEFVTDHIETLTKLNPLGAKGVGEGATIGAPPAIVTAALDALSTCGVTQIDMPLSPDRIWSAIATNNTETST